MEIKKNTYLFCFKTQNLKNYFEKTELVRVLKNPAMQVFD